MNTVHPITKVGLQIFETPFRKFKVPPLRQKTIRVTFGVKVKNKFIGIIW